MNGSALDGLSVPDAHAHGALSPDDAVFRLWNVREPDAAVPEDVFFSAGIHPWDAGKYELAAFESLKEKRSEALSRYDILTKTARYLDDAENRLLESYISYDEGKSYLFEQVVKAIPRNEHIKIWRPIVPIYAQDNLPVYWHEGIYSAHTGGWHCDAVMLVEYDD